jgi:hypothetical protein
MSGRTLSLHFKLSGNATLSSRQRTFAYRPYLYLLPEVFLILWFLSLTPTA